MTGIKVRDLSQEFSWGSVVEGVTWDTLNDEAVRAHLRKLFDERGTVESRGVTERLPAKCHREERYRAPPGYSVSRYGYLQFFGGLPTSLMARGDTQRYRLRMLPALSLVPEARPPPNGCWPTTAPVLLSFT